MIRGELWTVRDSQYARKARPAVIVQADDLQTDSVIVALLTSEQNLTISTRVVIMPNPQNGLKAKSYVMAEKPTTLPRTMLSQRIGVLSEAELNATIRAIAQAMDITAVDIKD